MITTSDLKKIFSISNGSDVFYKMSPIKISYTQGVKEVMDKANAHWLVSDVLVILTALKRKDFTAIKLTVEDNKAELSFTDGNRKVLYTQKYKYTDFPTGKWLFFYQNNVLMLNTEY